MVGFTSNVVKVLDLMIAVCEVIIISRVIFVIVDIILHSFSAILELAQTTIASSAA
jgi:hypothetical protein